MWDGAPLAGRKIMLHSEQGVGDTIQFVRYAALVTVLMGAFILGDKIDDALFFKERAYVPIGIGVVGSSGHLGTV